MRKSIRIVSQLLVFAFLAAQLFGILPGGFSAPVAHAEDYTPVSFRADFSSEGDIGVWKTAGSGAAYSNASIIDDATASDGKALRLTSLYQSNPIYNTAWPLLDDGSITVRMKSTASTSGNATLGLTFRASASGATYNLLNLMGNQGGTKNTILAQTNATWKDPYTSATQTLEMNRWYEIKLEFVARKISLTVDGVKLLDNDTSWSSWNVGEGYVGLFSWGTTQTYVVDYIEVKETEQPRPSTPSIISQPQNTTCEAGKTATFSVEATAADGTLTYQWQTSANGTSWTNATGGSGAATASYTTASLALANNGAMYRCQITNTLGDRTRTVYSEAAVLTVNPSTDTPIILAHPTDKTVYIGQTTSFSVEANNQSGNALTYNWQQSSNGTNWSNAAGTRNEITYTTPVLTSAYNGYLYRCQVSCGGQTTVTNSARLRVAAEWPADTEPVYTTFGEGEARLLNWKSVTAETNYAYQFTTAISPDNRPLTPVIVDDPSAMNGKALRIDFAGTANYIYSTDLPSNIVDGEYAIRVKATRPSVDTTTQEVRLGMIFRRSSTSAWNEITRSGSGWFAQYGPSAYSGNLNAEGVFSPGQWHTMRAIFAGSRITLYFDGVKVVDNYNYSTYSTVAGALGLRSFYTAQSVYIDNLYVGPIRSDSELPEEFKVVTPREPAFDYAQTYSDGVTGNWINAMSYVPHSSQIVDDETAADGKALKLDLPASNIMLVDTASSYTKDATYKIRLKSKPASPIKHEFDPINEPGEYVDTAGNIALVIRYDSLTTYAVVYYNAATSTWDIRDANNIKIVRGEIGKGPIMLPDTWYDIRLRYSDKTLKLYVNPGDGEVLVGSYIATNVSYPSVAGLIGVGSIGDAKELYIDSISCIEYLGVAKPDPEPAFEPVTISSPDMTVEMDNRFPVPRSYTLGGKTVLAQRELAYTLDINGEEWLAEVVDFTADGNSAVYNVKAYEDKASDPDNYVTFRFTYRVEGTTLPCEIKVTGESKTRLYNFEMAGITLAKFVGAAGTNAVNDNIRGDGYVNPGTWNNMSDVNFNIATRTPGTVPYSAGFITNLNTSANVSVGLINDSTETPTRSLVTLVADDDTDSANIIPKTLSINNGPWAYRGAVNNAEFPNAEADFPAPGSMNFRVLVALDGNASGRADWQDAANLYRLYAPIPKGGEDIRDYFSYVSFNFNSLAENPFLRGLDDGKKLYNYTDGFGQMILEKGYQAEGHDDSHPDVGNHIGIRQGGVKDFNTLINEGKKYKMKIGVHVNVGEYILDSFFNTKLNYFYRDANGYPNSNGWGWVDQAFYFDQTKDLLSGELRKRFQMLKENAPGLDWIYVDIYSGADWRAKQVSSVLREFDWMNATEFSGPMEQNVVWTHWGTDLYYPTSGDGSKVFRYLYNDTKDAFPTTSPYVSSMLRGSVQPGLSTWQNRTSMAEGVRVFYNQNLPSKYMQYFPVARWEDSEITFGAPRDDNGNYVQSMAGAKSVLDGSTTKIYAPDGTLVAIMDYALSGGAVVNNGNASQVFIPWSPITEDKIYYWNAKTGSARTTAWTLPTSWADQTTVQIYRLSDTGKTLINGAFPVGAGRSLDLSSLSSSTPYIIYKNGAVPKAPAADFGAVEAGGHLADPGFDTHSFDHWRTGNQANVGMKLDSRANGVMEVGSEAATVTNKIVNLTPGKTYTASVWLQIGSSASSARQVTLRVTDTYGLDVSKTAVKTAINNYDEPGKWKATVSGQPYPRMTRIEVRFTANADGEAVFALEVAAGSPAVVFDDARIWENQGKTVAPAAAYYYEDFENISEGYGPFVYYNAGGGNNTHLSEKAPVSINGYATNQYENYVISGSWSLKTYEDKAISAILRTTPNTLKFKPNTTYTVQFNYTTATNNVYFVRAFSGSGTQIIQQRLAFVGAPRTNPEPGVASITFTTPADDEDCYLTIGCSSAPGSLHSNFLMIDDFAVYDETAMPHVKAVENITSSNILETLQANLKLRITGEQIAGREVLITIEKDGAIYSSGKVVAPADSFEFIYKAGTMPVKGEYLITARVDGRAAAASTALTIVEYSMTIWDITLGTDEGGRAALTFFVPDIRHKTAASFNNYVTLNGSKVTRTTLTHSENTSMLVLDDIMYDSLKEGDVIVVNGVKMPSLFPSYSFTFTARR